MQDKDEKRSSSFKLTAMMEVQPASSNKWFGTFSDNIKASTNFSYFINDYFFNAVANGEEDLNYLNTYLNTLERYNKHSLGLPYTR